MKKGLIIAIVALLAVVIVAGVVVLDKLSSPEYALAKTIEDVKANGMAGLDGHLTENARTLINTVADYVGEGEDDSSGGLGSKVQRAAVALLKEQMAQVTWTLEDILRGRKQSSVVIGFDYLGKITGTIDIEMVREGREWKIDGVSFPSFNTVSLW